MHTRRSFLKAAAGAALAPAAVMLAPAAPAMGLDLAGGEDITVMAALEGTDRRLAAYVATKLYVCDDSGRWEEITDVRSTG